MNKIKSVFESVLLWVFAFVFTVGIAYYQRTTGPTYPIKGEVEIAGEKISYKLIRSDNITGDTEKSEIRITAKNKEISGEYIFKRYKSHDEWTTSNLRRDGDDLVVEIPRQPMAGKVEYQVILKHKNDIIRLTEEPVIMRFKGIVPMFALLPHIIFMFLAMVFSTRAGMEAIFKGKRVLSLTKWTLILLAIGGLILGPVIQKYAFDAYWTGWPFGTDLTDNKTIVAFIFWLAAFFMIKKKQKIVYAIVAAVVLIVVYMIPHSALGSEIDHRETEQITE